MELQLVKYLVVNADGSLPEIPNCLYAYIMAGNGVFVYARRSGLEALIPVASCRMTGLPGLTPWMRIAQTRSCPLAGECPALLPAGLSKRSADLVQPDRHVVHPYS